MGGSRDVLSAFIMGVAVVLAGAASIEAAETRLQGSWSAKKAEHDGAPADDVVGHVLTFDGPHFRIMSAGGKPLFAGTFRIDADARPASIDFMHKEGALAGKAWKGIYALDGSTLSVCDNAPDMTKARPASLAAPKGSGYVLITFMRASR